MKVTKFGMNYSVATMSIRRHYPIRINKNFNSTSIPIIRDLLDPNNFRLENGVLETKYLSVEVRDFNGYGAVMQTDESNLFIETILSRFISLLLRRAHLQKLSDSLQMSYIGKMRVREEIKDLNNLIEELGKVSSICSNVVLRVVDMRGANLIWQSADPLSNLLGNAVSVSRESYSSSNSLVELVNDGLPDAAFNTILHNINDRFDAQRKLLIPPKIFGGSIDFANGSISINAQVLKFLCQFRHMLSSCSDVVFNLMLVKEDYSSNELFNRGTQLKSILYELSVRFPFLKSNINRRDFITNTGELLNAIYESDEFTDFIIEDINLVNVTEVSQSLSTMYRTLTKMQVIQLAGMASRMESGKLVFSNNSYIVFDKQDAFIQVVDRKFTLIPKVIQACNVITAVVMCGLKINSSNSGNFSLDIRHFLCRLDPNFSVGE